jgi:hypothetical protein
MTRRYKVLLPVTVSTADGSYKQGDEFDADYDPVTEREHVESGLLELQPLTYKVVGSSRVHDTDPGETFELALPLGQEQLLMEGGQIEPYEEPKKRTRKKETEE